MERERKRQRVEDREKEIETDDENRKEMAIQEDQDEDIWSTNYGLYTVTCCVTDLQGPPSERTQTEKLRDLKKLAQQYAHDWGLCDDVWISYLEFLELEAEENLTLARMISG
jgi:hypothetical protein